jgi:tellurium resistance protein TerZ
MTSHLLNNETLDLFHHFQIPLEQLSVMADWDSIDMYKRNFLGLKTKKITENIDLELTCIMFDSQNQMTDLVCSSKFNSWLIKNNFPLGKSISKDGAFKRIEQNSNKKLISVDLKKISDETESVFFYLNFDLRKIKSPDFSAVKSLKMTYFSDHTLENKISESEISTENSSEVNEGILVVGKLFREGKKWKFKTINKTIDESSFIRMTKIIQ